MAFSIFRYPGGKIKAIKFIKPVWNQIHHDEYREPFVGGGSVYLAKDFTKYNWINDLDNNLYSFYKIISSNSDRQKLIDKLLKTKISKKLHNSLFYSKPPAIAFTAATVIALPPSLPTVIQQGAGADNINASLLSRAPTNPTGHPMIAAGRG